MAENLAYLPSVSPPDQGSYTSPYYYVYGYDSTDVSEAKTEPNYQTYGVLYNWPAAMAGAASSNTVPSGVQGICPAGWHLPSDAEWMVLEEEVESTSGVNWNTEYYRGTDAGGNLKETGYTHWVTPNAGATDSSGFTCLPSGNRYEDGTFNHLGSYTDLWTSTEFPTKHAWVRYLDYLSAGVGRYHNKRSSGNPVRCTKD